MTPQDALGDWAGNILSWDEAGDLVQPDAPPAVILICEHASSRVVAPWSNAGADLLASHAASDPGALGLALALGPHLARGCAGAELIHAPLSRLIYDLNRSPDRPDACPTQSEIHHIALNEGISATERLVRLERLYLPFHDFVRARIARALTLGQRPVILTIHSFSATWHGVPRKVEFGVIHDEMPALARQIVAQAGDLGLVTELNAPYSAADHVTHTLRLHALPYGLENAMLELRNDLIATQDLQEAMAARLATVLVRAIDRVTEVQCPAL
ncbi:N-formylglutamate amidohydrolase [Roseinatronobacter sp.]|uniref:N-formylglutamate amidohydrolase n=1 Tax=Roseinatronobacter sp. TaxID=1945755 RepID=UPI0025E5F107|nr:N-formylglutamate amidohydrolase [Rhodobaca sp.]